MWRFLLLCALAIVVQGASVNREDLIDTVKKLLSRINERDNDVNHNDVNHNDVNHNDDTSTNAVSDSMPDHEMQTPESLLRTHYPELFYTLPSEIEDVDEIGDALEFINSELSTPEMDKLCLYVSQIIGALRYYMGSDIILGDYESIRHVLEPVFMQHGHGLLHIDDLVLNELQYAILEPLWNELERLECEIGLTKCNVVEPQTSPSEELYRKMHEHFQSIDLATTYVGDILLDCFDIGAQWYNGVNMATCDADIADKVVEYLRPAVSKVEKRLKSLDTLSEIFLNTLGINPEMQPGKAALVNKIVLVLLNEDFADYMLAPVKVLSSVLDEIEHDGLSAAAIHIKTKMFEMFFMMETDETLWMQIENKLNHEISDETWMSPIYTLSEDHVIEIARYVLEAIKNNWQTDCLNARLLGMYAGLTEVQKVVAATHPGINVLIHQMSTELGVSIVDPRFKTAVERIFDAAISDGINDIAEVIHGFVGLQPTEATFIHLGMKLGNPSMAMHTVRDMVDLVLETVVPLLGHDHVEDSPYKCMIDDEALILVAKEARILHENVKQASHSESLKQVINQILEESFSPDSTVMSKIPTLLDEIVSKLHDDVLDDVLSTLEEFQVEDNEPQMQETMVEFLALNLGEFVNAIVAKHPSGTPPVIKPTVSSLPPVIPTNRPLTTVPPFVSDAENPALDFIHWQQNLITQFVLQYVQGVSGFTTKHLDLLASRHPCEVMPDLCQMIAEKISQSMHDM